MPSDDNFLEREYLVVLAVAKYLKPPVVQPNLICILPKTSSSGNITAIVPEVYLLSLFPDASQWMILKEISSPRQSSGA